MVNHKDKVDSELFEYLKTCPALECIQVIFFTSQFYTIRNLYDGMKQVEQKRKRCRYTFTIYFRKAVHQIFETICPGMD